MNDYDLNYKTTLSDYNFDYKNNHEYYKFYMPLLIFR